MSKLLQVCPAFRVVRKETRRREGHMREVSSWERVWKDLDEV